MNIPDLMQEKITEESIKQELEQTLASRVQRYLKVKPHGIVPYTKFAPASAECTFLFRDGHFYGCIALAQAVAEAIVRFLCQRNSWRPGNNFEKNVQNLCTRKFISKDLRDRFFKIWEKRDDYHHLNPKVETDRQRLEEIAYEKVLLLKEIESEIFAFSVIEGRLAPKNNKYWGVQQNGSVPVYLKLD